jgi:hypothetical protein
MVGINPTTPPETKTNKQNISIVLDPPVRPDRQTRNRERD